MKSEIDRMRERLQELHTPRSRAFLATLAVGRWVGAKLNKVVEGAMFGAGVGLILRWMEVWK